MQKQNGWVVVGQSLEMVQWVEEMIQMISRPDLWKSDRIAEFRVWMEQMVKESEELQDQKELLAKICEFQYRIIVCRERIERAQHSKAKEEWERMIKLPLIKMDLSVKEEKEVEVEVRKDDLYDHLMQKLNLEFYHKPLEISQELWKTEDYSKVLDGMNQDFFKKEGR